MIVDVFACIALHSFLRDRLAARRRSPHLAWLGPALWVGCELAAASTAYLWMGGSEAILWQIWTLGFAILGALFGAAASLTFGFLIKAKPLACPRCEREFLAPLDRLIAAKSCLDCGLRMRIIHAEVTAAKRGSEAPRSEACAACSKAVDSTESVACTGCLARHHERCWDRFGECLSCGDRQRFSQVEETEGRKRGGSGVKDRA